MGHPDYHRAQAIWYLELLEKDKSVYEQKVHHEYVEMHCQNGSLTPEEIGTTQERLDSLKPISEEQAA